MSPALGNKHWICVGEIMNHYTGKPQVLGSSISCKSERQTQTVGNQHIAVQKLKIDYMKTEVISRHTTCSK